MRHTFELATHHALAEMPTTSGGDVFEVPEFVNILPMPDADDRIESRDYRTLVVDSMEKLVKRSNAALRKQGGGGLVDKDHKSYGYFRDGTAAIGWAESFELRDDGIYARTMWLPEGREAIAQGKYRYTSSVINGPQEWVYDEMGYPTRLDIFPQEIEGFGITNTPALATLAMFAADEDTMDKHTIEIALGKLGLSPAAVATLSALPLEQIQQRLTVATATRSMFTAEGDAPADDVEPAEPEDIDQPAAVAPVGDLIAATEPEIVAELSKARDRIKELEEANSKLTADAAESLVASLVHSGKVTPGQRADVLSIAQEPGGIARVAKLYGKAAPVIAAGSAPRTAAKTTADEAPQGVDPDAWKLSADKSMTASQMAEQLKKQRAGKREEKNL